MKLNSKIGLIIAGIVIIAALGTTLIYNSFIKGDEVANITNTDDGSPVVINEGENDITATLPTLKNKAQFVNLLKTYQKQQNLMYGNKGGMIFEDSMATAETTTATDSADGASGVANNDFSGTNNQVVGVDEGDTLKTDGSYLYKIDGYGEGVSIVDANPNSLDVVSTIKLPADNYASQLFLANDKLVIITSYYEYTETPDNNGNGEIMYDMIWWGGDSFTKAYIYDLSDKSSPRLENEYQFKGNYVSGRTIDNILYFVTNEYMYYDWYTVFEDDMNIEDQVVLPSYKDCTIDEEYTLDYADIRYFPGAIEPSYMNTIAIDLTQPSKAPAFNAYLGSAYNIYVSTDALYTAVSEYTYDETDQDQWSYEVNTDIYKFDLDGTSIVPVSNTVVPGNIINQFSMDEYQGNFRITTTIESMWWDENDESTNNLYILNGNLDVIGSVEGLAEGERIYSTRFMGDKVYMVTFKQVDPLFVIDTSDPTKPEVLGYLKIPGVSQYLHPIDENHLLGFGQDSVTEGDRTYLTGFKISLFDVTDSTNPIEMQSEIIGGLGTYSELLYNHKALMYSAGKELMAFPIQMTAADDYMPTFIGGVVYHVNGDGFAQMGLVSHIDESAYDTQDYYNDWDRQISRFVYIGDVLYSISNQTIEAHNIETLEVINSVDLY